jgi:hypothetical protein
MVQPNVSDQVQLGQQLEAVFMPHATRERKAVIDRNGRFVHYTTAEAGRSIIMNQEMWLRSTTCMSDYSEVLHGHAALGNHPKLGTLLKFLDQSLNGIGEEARVLFEQWWDDTRFQTYIASISEHDDSEDQHGRLSMWRAFARSSARVALVFKFPHSPQTAESLNIFT